MKNIAIITARGGSKRIPRKNIKLFLGKPIIVYSIESALSCGLFERVMVSTDDFEIADIAKGAGAEVPFFRDAETSGDFTSTAEVITEVLSKLSKLGHDYDNICCIYPTAPFITNENLKEGFRLITENNYDSVFPVCQFSFPIFRAMKINEAGQVAMIWPENMIKRSQDLPTTYHDAGQFYWLKRTSFINQPNLFTENSGSIILSELEVQDIDNLTDWSLAELKYQLKNKLNHDI